MTEQTNPGAGCLTHAALWRPSPLQAAFLPPAKLSCGPMQESGTLCCYITPQAETHGAAQEHTQHARPTHTLRHSFAVGSLPRAQQITLPGPRIQSTELHTANSAPTRRCTAFLIKAQGKEDYGVCLPKPPLCVLRPCFPGTGWTSACRWEVMNKFLFLRCLRTQLLLFLLNCLYLGPRRFFSSYFLLWSC